jgi:hypothetical protein
MSNRKWTNIYLVFYIMSIASITLSVIGLSNAYSLACLDCPDGKNGTDGAPGICDDCCPVTSIGLTGALMYWTEDNAISINITAGQGWPFTHQRVFTMASYMDTDLPNTTLLNFTEGLWQLTYDVSLSVGTTTALSKNGTDLSTECGSFTQQAFISGISIQNISATQGFSFTTLNSVARAVRPGPGLNGTPFIRIIAIPYA